MASQHTSIRIATELVAAKRRERAFITARGGPTTDVRLEREIYAAMRAQRNLGGPEVASIEEIETPFRMRIYRPALRGLLPALVWLHGGGWRTGDITADDKMIRLLMDKWDGMVLSIDYAKAPEHPFPAAVEGTTALFHWVIENCDELGIAPEEVCFGGSSAGANVALGALINDPALCDLFAAGALANGVFDFDLQAPSMQAYATADCFMPREHIALFFDSYLKASGDDRDPRACPVLADCGSMPPLFLVVAEFDPFRSGSEALSARLASAKRQYQLRVYPGTIHGFLAYGEDCAVARRAIGDMADFLSASIPRITAPD